MDGRVEPADVVGPGDERRGGGRNHRDARRCGRRGVRLRSAHGLEQGAGVAARKELRGLAARHAEGPESSHEAAVERLVHEDDGVVDAADGRLVSAAVGRNAADVDRRMDYDGDGRITLNDYRQWTVYYRTFLQ